MSGWVYDPFSACVFDADGHVVINVEHGCASRHLTDEQVDILGEAIAALAIPITGPEAAR